MVTTAHLLLKQDNLREDWHRALMAAYARLGKRETALAQFGQCGQLLREELDVEPASETVALAEAIRRGQIGPETFSMDSEVTPSGVTTTSKGLTAGLGPKSRNRLGLSRSVLAVIGAISLIVVSFLVFSGVLEVNSQATQDQGGQSSITGPTNQQGVAVQEFAGTTVTILGPRTLEGPSLFNESMKPFEERTGIKVAYVEVSNGFENYIVNRVKEGNPPDIAQFPQPGLLADLTIQGKVVDVIPIV